MSDETTLLPCPICGGQPDFQHFNITPNVKGRIICACGLSLVQGKNDTEDDMRIIWNTRTYGTLTAEQVREAIEQHSIETLGCRRQFRERDWQAIADELNAELGSGTCRNISELNKNGVSGYYFTCSECGLSVCASMGVAEIEMSGSRSFSWKTNGRYEFEKCPRCGKAVER